MNIQSRNWKDPLYLYDNLSIEEKNISKTAREFCKSILKPRVIDDNKNKFFEKDLFKEFGKLGFLGSTINGYDCPGVSYVSYGLIAKEFEAIDSGYRSAISVQSSLVMFPIFKFGSDSQKNKYLPSLSKGKIIGCFGLTESYAGSDPGSITTKVVKKK